MGTVIQDATQNAGGSGINHPADGAGGGADPVFTAPIAALLGDDLNVDSGTIAPVRLIHRVNGSLNLHFITPPDNLSVIGRAGFFVVIPTSNWPWQEGGGGNIAISGTAVIGLPIIFVWSKADELWYPLAGFSLAGGIISFPGNGAIIPQGNLTLFSGNSFFLMTPDFFYIAVSSSSPQFKFLPDAFVPFLGGPSPVGVGSPTAPFDLIDAVRYYSHGTPLVAGNFSLSAEWGDAATVVVIEGDDSEFIIEITSNGAGQAPAAICTLLFQDGPWGALATPTPPVAHAKLVSIDGVAVTKATDVPISEGTTSGRLMMTFGDTPVAGSVYRISAIVAGYDPTTIPQTPAVPPVAVQTPPATGKTVMPIGDSITLGTPFPPGGGYRTFLWEYFEEFGSVIDFVGTFEDGPDQLGNKHHQAVSGIPISGIQANILTWLGVNPNPDAILLHAGTNDLDPVQALIEMGTLLDTIIANTVDTQIFLAQITPRDVDPPPSGSTEETYVIPYNAGMPALAGARVRVTVVNIHDALNFATDIADTIHPNARGYRKMAVMWWNALAAFFP